MNKIISQEVCEQIFAACEKNKLDEVVSIIHQHDNYAHTAEGFYFPHIIGHTENIEIFDSLVKYHGLDPFFADSYGYTPLHLAAKFNKLKTLSYLVGKCKADVETKTHSGYTPLICAITNSELSVISYLIEIARADVNVTLPSGKGLLQLMQNNPHSEVLDYIKSLISIS